jgi:hypothetical protein
MLEQKQAVLIMRHIEDTSEVDTISIADRNDNEGWLSIRIEYGGPPIMGAYADRPGERGQEFVDPSWNALRRVTDALRADGAQITIREATPREPVRGSGRFRSWIVEAKYRNLYL